MPKTSAGILLYRTGKNGLEVLLVHPGGPFWKNKEAGAWSIPKGEADEGEDMLAAAKREFAEELGTLPPGELIPLGQVVQKAGEIVHAWALAGDLDVAAAAAQCNVIQIEWPPKSKKMIEIPEIDRAEFFDLATAREKINEAQSAFLDLLAEKVKC